MSDDAKRFDPQNDQKREDQRQRKPLDPMNETGQQNEPPQWVRVLNALLLAFLVFYAIQLVSQSGSQELSYNEFKERVTAGKVSEVTIEGHQVTGTMEDAGGSEDPSGQQMFRTYIPEVGDTQVVDLLEQNGVIITAKESGPDILSRLLVSFLPWLIILGLVIFFWQRMQRQMGSQQAGGLFSMGKSKAKRFSRDEPGKTFKDIAGSDNAKKDLTEIVDYLKNPDFYQRLGAKLPRGVLMVGPPGTGKTLMARAVAGEADVPFFSISGSEFIEMFVGVGASRVRNMFEEARKESPSIIFIDELDAIGRSRGAGVGGGHDEREQTLNQILSEMDGFSPHETVVVIAATNRPDVLDPALLRPGRFDRKVTLDRPHRQAREKILGIHTKAMPLGDDVDLAAVARRTVGFAGADLENLANEAALFAGRDDSKVVCMRHFDMARDKVLMGAKREQNLSDDEKKVIAFHESGHALTALLFPKADPLEKVTIIPRGQALGLTEQAPDEDRLNMTASYARDRIAVMLGGRASEQLIFNEVSSGAENDIEQATKLARRMVSRWGMSEVIGPMSVSSSQEEVFLGHEISREREYSEATAEKIDDEVRKLITGIEKEVNKRLEENRDQLERLANTLFEEETLEASDIDSLLDIRVRDNGKSE
ncbi:cell division protein FtsH [Marinobacter vulgaris]|uniref:ATP-dependent zinc metalloprotease FtsH n=1 Tax=Marinobacter vulgaris TaxID=1928331 RepID=A0A2V3ZSX1_9GAMM|nr:ATP-dependent zinc metalloprotease FtsH [Marinobacter vulgaris]PXX93713.1 cell division protein FtsH [Marinobacter vulgaris]TSJ72272.1 ATP-dependent zinc metalloprotease FtsH [Marinobacter vulgaris]